MIKAIALKTSDAGNAEIDITPLTVFVGPNNSGKSRLLMEIGAFLTRGQKIEDGVLLENIRFEEISDDEAKEMLKECNMGPVPSAGGGRWAPKMRYGSDTSGHFELTEIEALRVFTMPERDVPLFCTAYIGSRVLMLGGSERIGLVGEKPAGDLKGKPRNSLQKLFVDDAKRKEVRRVVFEAFGVYFVIDPTQLGTLQIRMSTRPPVQDLEERGIHEEAVNFHSLAEPISNTSDGVKAFTGILTEVVAGDPRVLLIDEPEAFLHPSLAYKLGLEISKATATANKRVFVATHSPQFLMGCIQSGVPVNIIRLTYRAKKSSVRHLASNRILELMRNPLLRSTGLLGALFYEFVVVTESDSDRAFYQEINERLLRFCPGQGIPHCLFLNAQNKQTVRILMKPLRELGIAVAGIVDVDVLKEGGVVWSSLLEAAGVSKIDIYSLGTVRGALYSKFQELGKDPKNGGVGLLDHTDRETALNLFERLEEYGLFVVRQGELESWLPYLGVTARKSEWLVNIFSSMGESPSAPSYVKPRPGDVWEFLGHVRTWLIDPSRKGMPS